MYSDRHKILAIALATGLATDDKLADLVPEACWKRLHDEGLLTLQTDHSDESYSFPTEAGRAWVAAVCQ